MASGHIKSSLCLMDCLNILSLWTIHNIVYISIVWSSSNVTCIFLVNITSTRKKYTYLCLRLTLHICSKILFFHICRYCLKHYILNCLLQEVGVWEACTSVYHIINIVITVSTTSHVSYVAQLVRSQGAARHVQRYYISIKLYLK